MPPSLVDDLVEEILLRFPPGEPASLFRAALVCKPWYRLISGPGFRRLFREFHRTPPVLGLFCSRYYINENRVYCMNVSHLLPTTAFPHHAVRPRMRLLDVRHGRVLFHEELVGGALVVWDPITDEEWKVPYPPQHTPASACAWTGTVLCSSAAGGADDDGCDHLDCHRRPFIVVFVTCLPIGPADAIVTYVNTYSSNVAAWSEPTCGHGASYNVDFTVRSALVRNTLYFANWSEKTILKYNMQLRQMAWIQLPSSLHGCRLYVLTTTEDGGLQLPIELEFDDNLYIWSMKDDDEVDARWEQNRVIDLNKVLPEDPYFFLDDVVGCTDGLGTIFVSAQYDGNDVVYAIDMMTYKATKVYESTGTVNTIIPYMSFYTPELEVACTGLCQQSGEEPSAGGSNA